MAPLIGGFVVENYGYPLAFTVSLFFATLSIVILSKWRLILKEKYS